MIETPTGVGNPSKADDPLDPMLSFGETCRYEGVSRWTLRKKIKAGTFPPGFQLLNDREGWPLSLLRARREKKARRASGAEPAPETAAPA